MQRVLLSGTISLICWIVFQCCFRRDRSRYRNCYLLFFALVSSIPFLISLAGRHGEAAAGVLTEVIFIALLIVPFFLIINGIVMIRREGRQIPHLLSLILGIIVLAGEIATESVVIAHALTPAPDAARELHRSAWFLAGVMTSVTVVYGSMSFVIFMLYTLFLHILPKKKDFDYVIIHGAGLLQGGTVSPLLKDRLDKAVKIYRRDPTPPKMIPSGGKGRDENVSEAEAMARYLIEQGIPETDIIREDRSSTTLENLKFSKEILDSLGGRKYTALVTSNFHVYRALRYCRRIGLACTGIGSHVAFYYWPSALIREFIAVHMEKKHLAASVAGWLLCMAGVLMLFFE